MNTPIKSCRSILFSLGIGACLMSSAFAAETGPYVGASLGAGVSALKKGGIDSAVGAQGLQVSSGTSDTQNTAYGLNLGYRLSPHAAVELGYVNLGKYGYQSNLASAANQAVTGEFEAQGATLAGVGILPLSHGLSLYGKLGLIQAHTKLSAVGSPGVATSNTSHDSTGTLSGAGLSYDLSKAVAATVEWNHYSGLGNPATGYGKLNTYTAGLKYSF